MKKVRFPYFDNKPIVTVRIRGNTTVDLVVLVDSGADYCTAPREVCELLELNFIEEREIIVPGGTIFAPVYEGVVEFCEIEKNVKIIGIDMPLRANIGGLLGREYLDDFEVCFVKGKNVVFKSE